MRSVNPRFTYLLTYLLTSYNLIAAECVLRPLCRRKFYVKVSPFSPSVFLQTIKRLRWLSCTWQLQRENYNYVLDFTRYRRFQMRNVCVRFWESTSCFICYAEIFLCHPYKHRWISQLEIFLKKIKGSILKYRRPTLLNNNYNTRRNCLRAEPTCRCVTLIQAIVIEIKLSNCSTTFASPAWMAIVSFSSDAINFNNNNSLLRHWRLQYSTYTNLRETERQKET